MTNIEQRRRRRCVASLASQPQSNNSGLTTALLLSKKPGFEVEIAARYMPGDYDIEYASPWAGANWFSVSKSDTQAAEWDRHTWSWLYQLANDYPDAGVHFQGTDQSFRRFMLTFQGVEMYNRNKDVGSATQEWFKELTSPNPWWRSTVPDVSTHDSTHDQAHILCSSRKYLNLS